MPRLSLREWAPEPDQQEQDRPLQLTNSLRALVYKQCRSGCPHSKHPATYPNQTGRRRV